MPLTRVRIALATLSLGVATPALAQDKVRFQTDWIPSGEHAMYYGGWQKGIFAAEGIDVTITRGYGSGDTVTKLAGGGFDFGVADMAAVMTARARQNVPVKTIAVVYSQSPHSLFVLKSSGITNFKGLEGKKIGITPGNSHKFYFPKVAERAGTDPNKITWVSMDGAAMAAQLIAKNLDAAPFYSIHHYYQNKAAKAAGEEIVVLPFVEVGFKIYAATIIATDKMIAEKPDLTKRFLRAIKKTFEFARDNPEETCKLHVAEDSRGRARRLPGQRARHADLRLQRPHAAVRLGQRGPGAARLHLEGHRRGAGAQARLGLQAGDRHLARREMSRCCVIEIENVSKHFVSRDRDRVAALTDVSISIRRNEFVCLVGPSGCGKSTLLRLVGGLLPVSQGRVVIDGRPVTEPRAETGIVFQSPTLLPWASVLDNVLFPLKMMKRITPDSPEPRDAAC